MDTRFQQLSVGLERKLRYFNFRKQSRLDSEIQSMRAANTQKQRLFKQNYELLGSPQNEYLIKKIRTYVNNVQILAKKRVKTEEGRSNFSTIKTSMDISPAVSNRSIQLLKNEQKSVERAYLINQSQKIERLISRKAEQEEQQKCLSQRIKQKVNNRKPIKIQPALKPIDKLTWYQKWYKSQNEEKSRRKVQIFRRLKDSNFKRFHTEEIIPIDVDL